MTPQYLYLLLFFLMFIEGTGMPAVPFEPVFLLAGYLIEKGEASFWLAVVAGTLGNFLGNLLGYWVGARPGRKLVDGLLRRWIDRGKGLASAKSWFTRYGVAMVIIARWFGPIRTPTILGAGILGMPPLTYAVYSLLGAFSWTLAWQYGSWRGTGVFINLWQNYRGKGLFILALALALAALYLYLRLRSISFRTGQPEDPFK